MLTTLAAVAAAALLPQHAPRASGAWIRDVTVISRVPPPLLQSPPPDDSPGGALALGGTQLEQALDALPEGDKYNAVLLSLLTKGGFAGNDKAVELVREMSGKRLKLSGPAVKNLVNAAVEGGAIEDIHTSMRAARENGACRSFATVDVRLPPKPPDSALNALADVPSDARGSEVSAAAALSLSVGALVVAEVLNVLPGVELPVPPPQLVALALAGGWATDRYFRNGALAGFVGRGLVRRLQLEPLVCMRMGHGLWAMGDGRCAMCHVPCTTRPAHA